MAAMNLHSSATLTGLQNKVAIVTGGSSGIGRAVCLALAAQGARIVIVSRSADRVTKVSKEIEQQTGQASTLGLALDVRYQQHMEQMATQTLEHWGRIDLLVACAGLGGGSEPNKIIPYPLAQTPVSEWDLILDTNLKGVFLSNRAVLPTMIAQRNGMIVNISSSPGGLHGQAFASSYCASNFGVVGLSEALRAEVSAYGVKIVVLFPDATDTPLLQNSTLALRRGPPMPPERVVNLITYLATEMDDSLLEHPVLIPYRTL